MDKVPNLAASQLSPMACDLYAVLEDRYDSVETRNKERLTKAEKQIRESVLGVLGNETKIIFDSQQDKFLLAVNGNNTPIGTIEDLITKLGISEGVLKGLAFHLLVKEVLAGKAFVGAAIRANQLAEELVPHGPDDGGRSKSSGEAA